MAMEQPQTLNFVELEKCGDTLWAIFKKMKSMILLSLKNLTHITMQTGLSLMSSGICIEALF